jgi:hypothetical protein
MSGSTYGALVNVTKGAGYGALAAKSYDNKTVGQSLESLSRVAEAYDALLPSQAMERVAQAQIMKVIAVNLVGKIPGSGLLLGRGNDAANAALAKIQINCQADIQTMTGWPRIPKIIHIIHLGHALPSAKYPYVQPNLTSFKTVNPDARLILWIDRSFLKTAEFTAMQLHANTNGYEIKDFMTEMEPKQVTNIHRTGNQVTEVDNSSAAGQLYGQIDQLLSRKGQLKNNDGPQNFNWGLISDLMRIAILLQFGGIYFDTDMAAGDKLPAVLYAKHGILVNIKGGQMTPCNDIIAVTPDHAVMKDYRAEILKKLTDDGSVALFQRLIDKSAPANDKANPRLRSATIQTSGPTTLRNAVQGKIPQTTIDIGLSADGKYQGISADPGCSIGKDYREVRFPPCYVKDSSTSSKAWLK